MTEIDPGLLPHVVLMPDRVHDRTPSAALMGEMLRLAMLLADRAAIDEIDAHATPSPRPDCLDTWLDVQPMLSLHERAPASVDQAACVIAYARMRGLTRHHPKHAHLVRVVRRP